MSDYKRGDMVRHKDGRTGMVERVTGLKISVQFEYSWRTSVVNVRNITLIEPTEKEPTP